MSFKDEYKKRVEIIDNYIENHLSSKYADVSAVLLNAMKYSVLNGGKRLRSILCMEICNMLGASYAEAMPFSAAIEYIHAYSLVHDDLPSMDNADYRRNQLSCHKKYGEAMGVLCGDALLNAAFEIMADNCTTAQHIKAMRYISNSSGANGMINGQVKDILISENGYCDKEDIINLIELKTMNLIRASAVSGAYLADADQRELDDVEQFSHNIGMAFQIRDDFEDIEEDDKNVSDSPNLVSYFGADKAKNLMKEYVDEANKILMKYNNNTFLLELVSYLFE